MLWRSAGAPDGLAALGMTARRRDTVIDLLGEKLPIGNARPVRDADVRDLLHRAYEEGRWRRPRARPSSS